MLCVSALSLSAVLVAAAPTPASSAPAAPPAAADAGAGREARAATFAIDPERRVYDIDIAFGFTTTIWFPVDCFSVVVGDPDRFAWLNKKDTVKNRVVITSALDEPGATTNITIDCAQGVRVVLNVRQGKPDKGVQSVEFAFSEQDDARVRTAVEAETKRGVEACDGKLGALKETLAEQSQEQLMRAMLRRFSAGDDVESARQNFVIVRAYREVLVGHRGFIHFLVHNRTNKDVIIKDVEVLDEVNGQAADNIVLMMPERRVGEDAIVHAVVAFDATEDAESYALVVREEGPRAIRVEDIDF